MKSDDDSHTAGGTCLYQMQLRSVFVCRFASLLSVLNEHPVCNSAAFEGGLGCFLVLSGLGTEHPAGTAQYVSSVFPNFLQSPGFGCTS